MTRALAFLLLPLWGCATVSGIRTAPLDAGVERVYPQPLPEVVAAAHTAIDSVHLTLDRWAAPDPHAAMLIAHRGMDFMSYGELVRILAQAQADGGTSVHVYTQPRGALNITHRDFADPVFRELGRALGRSASDSSGGRWAPQAAALISLGAGATIRVRTRSHGRLQGGIGGASDSSLTVGSGGATTTVAALDIDSLWSSVGHARTGATLGSLAGFVAALAAGPYQCSGYNQVGSCSLKAELRGLGFVAGGALVGAIVGSAVRSWQLRYP